MIDLHTHTDESDGTYSPAQLVQAALDAGLEALAVTDHDTFAGFDTALPTARAKGLDLICGIELSTRLQAGGNQRGRTVHLLGYFLDGHPAPEFREWLDGIQAARRDRNIRLTARLRSLGLDIHLEEAQAMGRSLTGRPHFARVLLNKGYVATMQEAFDRYLDESAPGYVERHEPEFAEGVRRIRGTGGLTSLAHPVRLGKKDAAEEEKMIARMVDDGLEGIEVYHSDHKPEDVRRYRSIAVRHDLAVTGGSDFHGDNKPGIRLGTGNNNNLSIPLSVLDQLRAAARM